jgi:hypothetical protein
MPVCWEAVSKMGSHGTVAQADTEALATNAPSVRAIPRLECVRCSGRIRRAAQQRPSGHVADEATTNDIAALRIPEAEYSWMRN